MTHEIPIPLAEGRGRVYLSNNVPREAVLFVHGFGGDAVETWQSFPYYLLREPYFSSVDVYFWEYDSLTEMIEDNADDLRHFVNQLFAECSRLWRCAKHVKESKERTIGYRTVTVVAHSMGAVVWRRAAIKQWLREQQKTAPCAWVKKVRFVLFAPAHSGANIIGMAAGFLSAINFAWLEHLVAFFIRPLADLRPESTKIKELKEDSLNVLNAGGGLTNCVVATKVIRARGDRIVSDIRFLSDPDSEVLAATHRSVCKPTEDFREPLRLLLESIVDPQ